MSIRYANQTKPACVMCLLERVRQELKILASVLKHGSANNQNYPHRMVYPSFHTAENKTYILRFSTLKK